MAKHDSEEILKFFEKKKLPPILGSEEFISWVKDKYFAQKKHRQVPASSQLAPEPEEIKRAVCDYYKIAENEILLSRRGKLNKPRNVAIYLSRILTRQSLLSISEAFNMTGYSSASSTIERVLNSMEKDKDFRKRIDIIKQSIFVNKGQTKILFNTP